MTDRGGALESCCPRCGGAFHCGRNDTRPCACASLDLDITLLARLREGCDGCLCMTCLAQLRAAKPTPE
jgi:transposase